MMGLFITSFFLFLFSFFNLLGNKPELLKNEILFAVIGLIVFLIIKKIGLQYFRVNAYFFYWLFVILLAITYIIGVEAKGSKRWIDLYFFSFQASEFFKIFFILFLAEFFTHHRIDLKNFSFFLLSVLYFFIPTIIIFKQPDLGTAMVYAFIFLMISLFSYVPKKYIMYVILMGMLLMPVSLFFLHDYQKQRLLSFVNPHVDTQGTAYNMNQAMISIGSGEFLGKGLGAGTQSNLQFLPESHTDFAYSSLVEQFGFMGGTIVIALYMIIIYFLIKKLLKYYYQKDEDGRFKFLFTLGFLAFVVFQIFVNIGMNLGIMPITGIALPIISYGGSSLITWMIGLALLV